MRLSINKNEHCVINSVGLFAVFFSSFRELQKKKDATENKIEIYEILIYFIRNSRPVSQRIETRNYIKAIVKAQIANLMEWLTARNKTILIPIPNFKSKISA